jgi:hypothetical protein
MRAVTRDSIERCSCVHRLAGVKCTRPSAVSGLAETVAALATHIAEAELAAASSPGASRRAAASTSVWSPLKPSARSVGRCGRSCGGSTPCGMPRSCSAFILRRPCSAASRGFDGLSAFSAEARLP